MRAGARRERGLQLRGQLDEALAHVADDRHVDLHPLGDRRRVDVDVDDLARVLGEVLRVADHPVVEARADREQHVAVLHCHVRLIGAVHARHADEALAARPVRTQPHQRVRAREAEQVDQRVQLGRGVGEDHAAAGVDHRTLGGEQQLQRLADLALMPLHHRVVRAHRHRLRVFEAVLRLGDVLGDVDQHRARTAGGRDDEGLLHRRREVLDVLDQEVVLHARPGDADRVALLERVLADGVRRDLTRDHDHRDRIHVGGGDAGDRVGHARAAGDEADPDLLRGTRVRIGRVDRCLLVPHEDVLDLLLLEERVVNVEDGPAGVPEEVLDAFFLKAAHDDLCAGDFHDVSRSRSREPARRRQRGLDAASTQASVRGLGD